MPVKFPMSGRYTNYHPIAIHTTNLYSSQTCLNETDDCGGNQMHCRAIVYHPATVYIPHTHTPPFHNASGGASLSPTPPSVSQQMFDSTNKNQCFNSRDYTKSGSVNAQNNYSKSQNHGIALSHQNSFLRAQNLGNSQPYKHSNIDGGYKYTTPTMSSRFSVPCNKKAAVSIVGSPACFVAQKSSDNYNSTQKSFGSNPTNQSYNYTNSQKIFNPVANFEHANGRKTNTGGDQYFENATKSNNYSTRKNTMNYRNNGVIGGQTEENTHSNSQSNDKYATNIENENSNSQGIQGTENSNSEKPVSPPPAPYSPMTRPLPTLSPPTSQVQFFAPAQNRYQPSLAPTQHHQQQQQSNAQRRYTIAPALSTSRKPPTEKYSNSGSQATTTTMLQQSKYKVNGIMQTGNKVTDDSLGGAGDAPPGVGRMPITPPGTPRTHPGHPAGDQSQLSDTCHQMQALSL